MTASAPHPEAVISPGEAESMFADRCRVRNLSKAPMSPFQRQSLILRQAACGQTDTARFAEINIMWLLVPQKPTIGLA